jgi:hypothetical protein
MRAPLVMALLLAGACTPPPKDGQLSIKLARGDADPLSDPGTAARGASPVGSLQVNFSLDGQQLMQTVSVGATKSLSLREVPTDIGGAGALTLLGLRSDDGLVYSAARSAPFVLDGGATTLELFFGPADALTPAGAAVPQPRSNLALAPLGSIGAVLSGGDTAGDAGSVPADPGLLVFKSGEAKLCGFADGCLSGDAPAPRSLSIAAALPSGDAVHGLGRLADGGLDSTLFLTSPDGTTHALQLSGDPLPGLAGALAVTLGDGTVVIAGGDLSDGGISGAIFHLDVAGHHVMQQSSALITARSRAGAVLLPSGEVLVVGGNGMSGPLDSLEVYTAGGGSQPLDGDAFTGVRKTMHGPRVSPSLARLKDDSIAIVGGGTVDDEIFRSDLGNRVGGLVDLTPPPSELRHVSPAAVRVLTGEVVIIGGEVASSAPLCAAFAPTPDQVLGPAALVYTGTWRACGAGLNLRARANATVLPDGSVLVAGGGIGGEPFNPGDPSASRVEIYEPSPP